MERLREDAWEIIRRVLAACQPGEAVERALAGADLGTGRVFLVAVGKAAWEMASRAAELLGMDRSTLWRKLKKYQIS